MDQRIQLLFSAGLHIENKAVQLQVEHGWQFTESDASFGVAFTFTALTEILVITLQFLIFEEILQTTQK